MLRSSLLKPRHVLKKKKIKKTPIPQHCGHSYSSWACRSLPEPLRWGGRAGGCRVGSSSSRVTQRWAQPESPNSHADAPHPSDSITPQLPSLSCCLVDGDPPPCPQDPVCVVALPGAAAEGWTRLRSLGSTGGAVSLRRASPALETQPHGGIIAPKRQKRHAKGCSPLALLCCGLNWSFFCSVLSTHGYLLNSWQQAVNIARYNFSRHPLPETRTHGAT